MVGFEADDPRLADSRRFIEARGGYRAARVFTRIWLSLFGLWPWEEIRLLPPELVFLRPGSFLRLPLLALGTPNRRSAHRRHALPPGSGVAAGARVHEIDLGPVAHAEGHIWEGSDRLLRLYAGSHVQPGRQRALAVAEQWIIDRQELDGSWGGIQPPWVWSLIALACRGHGHDSPT